MSTNDENKNVVLRLIDRVWRQGHIEELPQFWTTDCLNHADPAVQKRGLEALIRYHEGFAGWFAGFENVEIAIDQQVAEGDRVVTQTSLRARARQSLKPFALASIRIDRMVDGKIAEHWSVAHEESV